MSNSAEYDVFEITDSSIVPSHSGPLYPVIIGGSGFCFRTKKLTSSTITVTVICDAYGYSDIYQPNQKATKLMKEIAIDEHPSIYGRCYFVLDEKKIPLENMTKYFH